MADPTTAQRKMYAASGIAMPDGSYYIRPDHPEDLGNAISAVGRASGSNGKTDEEQRNAVRCHIMKRAKALKRTGEIPASWNPDGSLMHFGVKGMHWGVRKSRSAVETPRAKPSTDAARAEKISSKAQGGVHTLTNKELKDLTNRLNLEQQYSKLTTPEQAKKSKDGKNFVQKYNGHAATGITAFQTTKKNAQIN